MTNAELIKVLRICKNGICKDCPRNGTMDCDSNLYSDAADALEAAEAQLPKGGEWKKILQNGDGTSDYECSACLGIIMNVPDDDEHPLCSFCPNCGAKMDGKEQ